MPHISRAVWLLVHPDNISTLLELFSKDPVEQRKLLYEERTFIDFETVANHFNKAKVPLYVVHQFKGDIVLVPSGYAHTVLNLGSGVSFKAAYNVLNPKDIVQSLSNIIDYGVYSKPENYRVKLVVKSACEELINILQNSVLKLICTNDSPSNTFDEFLRREDAIFVDEEDGPPSKKRKINPVSIENRQMSWFVSLRKSSIMQTLCNSDYQTIQDWLVHLLAALTIIANSEMLQLGL